MNIHTAAHYMRSGFRVNRPGRHPHNYLTREDSFNLLHLEDLLADDWEIVYDNIVAIKADSVEYKDEL